VVWLSVNAAGFAEGSVSSEGRDCVESVYETPVSRPRLIVPQNFSIAMDVAIVMVISSIAFES